MQRSTRRTKRLLNALRHCEQQRREGIMKISITVHESGRAFRTTRERSISFEQALNIHDPFVNYPFSSQNLGAPRPCWTLGAKIRTRFI
jgi:hypothetical protein